MEKASRLISPGLFQDSCQHLLVRVKSCVVAADADRGRYKGEIDDFVSMSEKQASKEVSIMHLIQPSDIDVRGSKALAESAGVIMSRFTHDGHEYDFTIWNRFISQVEKFEGKWKLLSLEVIYIRDLIVPVPGSPELDFSDVKGWPRKSYRFTAWHLMQRGLKVRDDLPGEDDDRTVNEIMDRNHAWIDA